MQKETNSHSEELQKALKFLQSINKKEYEKDEIKKNSINQKIYEILYIQPKFTDQAILVDEIHTSFINNLEIFLIIKENWTKIPNLLKDKFFYFIEKSLQEIPLEIFFDSDVEIKNFVLKNIKINKKEIELINSDILRTNHMSTLLIYKKNHDWFDLQFLLENTKNGEISRFNRKVLYEILDLKNSINL